ncbi:MAG: hypothetical protein HYX86_04940 [Chloroflexi bacterium]|nr:hypothetical protein [Chloroflexota bacterium]
MTPEVVGTWAAAILTLMVFSFLLSDNPLFRLAEHLLVGTTLAYATVVAVQQVLLPRLVTPLAQAPQANWHLFVPLGLGLLLFFKVSRSLSWVGNVSLAFLFGVGAALAIGGGLSSSLLPQVRDTIVSLSPADLGPGTSGLTSALDNLLLVVGTLGTLAYFNFTARSRKSMPQQIVFGLGRGFIMITLGALFANLAISRLSLLLERLQFLLGDWLGLIS